MLRNFMWEVLEHPPYSPDLAPSNFHLFLIQSQNDILKGSSLFWNIFTYIININSLIEACHCTVKYQQCNKLKYVLYIIIYYWKYQLVSEKYCMDFNNSDSVLKYMCMKQCAVIFVWIQIWSWKWTPICLACFSYFEKIKGSLWKYLAVCVSVYFSP
jgi:hypothetical protein